MHCVAHVRHQHSGWRARWQRASSINARKRSWHRRLSGIVNIAWRNEGVMCVSRGMAHIINVAAIRRKLLCCSQRQPRAIARASDAASPPRTARTLTRSAHLSAIAAYKHNITKHSSLIIRDAA